MLASLLNGLNSPQMSTLNTYKLISKASTNCSLIKSSPGQLYGWSIYNPNNRFIKLYNKPSLPIVGTDIPLMTLSTSESILSSNGINFTHGMSLATTSGIADNSTTLVAANDLVVNLFYI